MIPYLICIIPHFFWSLSVLGRSAPAECCWKLPKNLRFCVVLYAFCPCVLCASISACASNRILYAQSRKVPYKTPHPTSCRSASPASARFSSSLDIWSVRSRFWSPFAIIWSPVLWGAVCLSYCVLLFANLMPTRLRPRLLALILCFWTSYAQSGRFSLSLYTHCYETVLWPPIAEPSSF